MDVGELTRLVFEQTPATQDCRVALQSPELFDRLSARCARPYVLVRDHAPGDLLAYIATTADLSEWTQAKAAAQLNLLQKGCPPTYGLEFGVRLQRLTAERLYALGRRLREHRNGSEIIDAHVGLLFRDQDLFGCYATFRARRDRANSASLTLDTSLAPDRAALADRAWLSLVSPIAYAASRVPGLAILDSLGKPRQVAAKPILAAAREAGIDYERYREIEVG
jgi:hypothetical protein